MFEKNMNRYRYHCAAGDEYMIEQSGTVIYRSSDEKNLIIAFMEDDPLSRELAIQCILQLEKIRPGAESLNVIRQSRKDMVESLLQKMNHIQVVRHDEEATYELLGLLGWLSE